MERFLRHINEMLSNQYDKTAIRMLSKMLVEAFCSIDGNSIYLCKDTTIPPPQREMLEKAVARLHGGEPIQYIVGSCEFYGMTFKVSPPVLIPRPETEELVDWIIKDLTNNPLTQPCRILDIGTGSGCIAVSLSKHLPDAKVEAWDILPEAIALTKENATLHGVNIEVKTQDLFEAATSGTHKTTTDTSKSDCFDIIASNPPYICQEESKTMERNVLEHESHIALFVPDDDPLKYYRALAKIGLAALKPGGRIYVEINSRFGKETVKLFESMGYNDIVLRQDLYGRDRMVRATLSH